jgi:hypothetical protein
MSDLNRPPPQGSGPYVGPPIYRPLPSREGPSVASAICGVMAVLIGWIPFVGIVGLGVGIAAVVTGIIGVQRKGERVLAGVGLFCGGAVVLAWAFGIVLLVVGLVQGKIQTN